MKTFLFGLALLGLIIWRLLSSHLAAPAPVITSVVSNEQGYEKALPILFRAEVAFAHRGDGSNIDVRHGLRRDVNRALLLLHGRYTGGDISTMADPEPGEPNYEERPVGQLEAMDYIDLNAAGARAVGTAHEEALFMAIVQRMPGPKPPKIVWPLFNEELAQLPENKAFYAQLHAAPAPASPNPPASPSKTP